MEWYGVMERSSCTVARDAVNTIPKSDVSVFNSNIIYRTLIELLFFDEVEVKIMSRMKLKLKLKTKTKTKIKMNTKMKMKMEIGLGLDPGIR